MRRGLGLVRYSGALRALAKMRRLAKRCRLEGGFGVGFGHGAGPAGEEWGEREGRVTESLLGWGGRVKRPRACRTLRAAVEAL